MSRFDLSTVTLGELLNDPEAKAIFLEQAPELEGNPMLSMALAMPFQQVMTMAAGKLAPDAADKIKAALAEL